MAGDAQVARMTRGAIRGDPGRTWITTVPDSGLAMSAEHEIGREMRRGFGETRNVFAGQIACVAEAQVTRRAGIAVDVDMRTLKAMAIEALSNDGVPNRHPLRAGLDMARGAVADECAVRGTL